jgi:restriction endonuclease Mrr
MNTMTHLSQQQISIEDFLSPTFSNKRLTFLTEMERISMALINLKREISSKEEKRGKFKDIMTALKEGNVQKDMKFWHFFEDKMFLKLSRKDSVNLTEKEIEKLNKDIVNLKKTFEDNKNKLMDLINDNIKFGASISDLDEEVSILLY